jgi:HK97 family phage prohead protease
MTQPKRFSDEEEEIKPELFPNIERRFFEIKDLKLEKRDDNPIDNPLPKITGHAAVFNKLSVDMGFREKIAPGAFKAALKISDARALFNHNPDFVLGRQSAGTLTLREDTKGLWMEVTPPNTTYARDLIENIRLGNIKEQSFGFTVKSDKWDELEGETPTRTLLEIGEVFDASVVTYPAYQDTTVALRSLEKAKIEIEEPIEADTTIEDIRSVYEQHVKEEEINEAEKATCVQSLKRLLDIFETKVEPMQDDGVEEREVEEKEESSEPMQGDEDEVGEFRDYFTEKETK